MSKLPLSLWHQASWILTGPQQVGPSQSDLNRASAGGTKPVGSQHGLSQWDQASRIPTGPQQVGPSQFEDLNRALASGTKPVGSQQGFSH